MVAQFLRLKLQLLANIFRRSVWQVVGIVLGLVYGLGMALLLFGALVGLRFVDDVQLVRDGIVVVGSIAVVGFVLVPLFFGVDDTLDPRRFALFGIRDRPLAFALAVTALVGIPALVLAIVLFGTVITWSRGIGETILAILGAALAFCTCLMLARVSTSLASLLLSTRRAREISGVIGLVLIVMLSPVIVVLVSIDWARQGVRVLEQIAGVLSWTPLGAAFAVPGDAAAGAWFPALLKLLIAAATLWLIWLAWVRLVALMLVTPGRETPGKAYHGLGWFDRTPGTVWGAIMARSLTYWFRDARYWVSFIIVPLVPVFVIVPLAIAGVPGEYLPLIPVPLICLFLGWSLHNDTAYDSTAVWLHIASGVRGTSDRLGRILPVLFGGLIVIGLGSAVTAFVLDDWRVLPSVIGLSSALLLSGLGVGAYTSAQFPYPAVKPGDSPFQQPQSTGAITALVQSVTMIGAGLFALPALWFGYLGLAVDPSWHLASLIAGTGLGLVVLVAGVLLGGLVFQRRGPEILAAAVRA